MNDTDRIALDRILLAIWRVLWCCVAGFAIGAIVHRLDIIISLLERR